ncbi:P-type DNA transfer ATPase VirB11 [Rhizobium rhizogenes]|uniref:Type IV secretion system protein n=1 Tax=Rhizobium rhizogenes TaxID=359 RepID=A0AA92H7B7_RHIRH|nr:P-type DNA transfer ATPase VirB11 [Rhizobium rhizogenes]PVE50156.1 P-type DNA transfer ATPase VirB11 [Rhizobium rhizogenes]PVE62583.1 P-type DNA transfer ATPase VirB11 [Agrobacterium tumefaciens]PVE70721.1 P-type DNA transfer ATPase VirB11 [Sphingomonas sp. TPD3009]
MNSAMRHQTNRGADVVSLWDNLPVFFRQMAQPLRFLLEDPAVIEIMCNRPGEIWVERMDSARMVRHEVSSLDERAIRSLAQMIAGSTQQNVNEETPLLSAAMPHGERFQAVLAPVAASGSAFAIRKQVIRDMSLDDYAELGGFDRIKVIGPRAVDGELSELERELIDRLRDPSPKACREWCRFAVENRVTMLISGGTSSGKTTFFNGLLKDIPEWERLITIEDTRELRPPQPNHLALVASKGGQGRARITIQDCLEAALRLRPDRIFMGEIRGAEAFSFLQAVNTGHPGSMSTLHADNPHGAYERLAMATMQAGLGLSKAELLEFVRFVVPVIVQVRRDPLTMERGVSEIYVNKWPGA